MPAMTLVTNVNIYLPTNLTKRTLEKFGNIEGLPLLSASKLDEFYKGIRFCTGYLASTGRSRRTTSKLTRVLAS